MEEKIDLAGLGRGERSGSVVEGLRSWETGGFRGSGKDGSCVGIVRERIFLHKRRWE